jgi:hypothetical protein
MAKQFIWLLDNASPRTGPDLRKGEKHKVADYPKAVVDEWVRTKAAEYVEEPAEKPKESPKAKK